MELSENIMAGPREDARKGLGGVDFPIFRLYTRLYRSEQLLFLNTNASHVSPDVEAFVVLIVPIQSPYVEFLIVSTSQMWLQLGKSLERDL